MKTTSSKARANHLSRGGWRQDLTKITFSVSSLVQRPCCTRVTVKTLFELVKFCGNMLNRSVLSDRKKNQLCFTSIYLYCGYNSDDNYRTIEGYILFVFSTCIRKNIIRVWEIGKLGWKWFTTVIWTYNIVESIIKETNRWWCYILALEIWHDKLLMTILFR